MNISAVVITLDEEQNLGRCLESLRGVAEELVVVDSGSTDGTERIAREHGATFVSQPWLGYGPQKNFAADRCAHEWILSLDADEALSDELRASILRLKAEGPRADAYEFNRLNWYCGRFLRHSGWYPDRKIRLWRSGRARWSEVPIHELVEPAPGARVARLRGDLLHYTCHSREQHLRTIDAFTTLSAQELARRGARATPWKRYLGPVVHFLRSYVLKLGFLDGAEGYQVCRLTAYAAWLKYEKLRRLREASRRTAAGAVTAGRAAPTVVHASTQRGWRGGEQQVVWLHARLAARGIAQRVVCPEGSELARRAAAAGADVVEAPGRGGVDPRFARVLARVSRGALVHAHDPGAHGSAVLASALFRTRAPVVVSRRVVFPIGRGPIPRWKYDHPSVRRILCGSTAIADVLRRAIRNPGRLRVVHDGIDPDRFAPGRGSGRLRRELDVPDGVPLVGTVAALTAEKDPMTFLEVAAMLLGEGRALRFVWVGEGPLHDAVAARARALGIADRVALAGFREDVADLLPGLDLFLFTSRAEGLGTSLLDAQAARVPVVATAAGGVPEAVRDRETGLLAAPGDARGLARHAARLLDDAPLRARLVEEAARRVRDEFGLEALADRTLDVYREALAEAGGAGR